MFVEIFEKYILPAFCSVGVALVLVVLFPGIVGMTSILVLCSTLAALLLRDQL